jgi:thioredoxin 1
MTHVQRLDEQSFGAEVLAAEIPVLVDFTATWCAPCRALEPILEQLAVAYAGRVKIASVDGERHPELAARYGVRGFPTLIAFVGGAEVGRQLGLTTATRIVKLFEPELGRDAHL